MALRWHYAPPAIAGKVVQMSYPLLIVCAFFSSALTAVLGLGGGILLISVMPGLLPAAAVVPVHGVVQLASNASRALFGLRHVAWKQTGQYAVGALVGAALGARWVVILNEKTLALLLGLFVLLVTWVPRLKKIRLPGRFAGVGAVQTFISLFVGAAGPLITPLLLRQGLPRDRLVVTHGAMMTVLHGLKVVAFTLLGFSLSPYLALLFGMIAAVILGSWAGTHLRGRLPEARFLQVLKVLLTLLAFRLLLRALP
jgi:uncharacterized membrane protein YfcA